MKYKLIMVVANIKHNSWWWNGKPCYQFNELDKLIDFMVKHIPLTNHSNIPYISGSKDIELIRENDKKQDYGRLASTSWYEIEKGEHGMTEFTSF